MSVNVFEIFLFDWVFKISILTLQTLPGMSCDRFSQERRQSSLSKPFMSIYEPSGRRCEQGKPPSTISSSTRFVAYVLHYDCILIISPTATKQRSRKVSRRQVATTCPSRPPAQKQGRTRLIGRCHPLHFLSRTKWRVIEVRASRPSFPPR